MKNLFSLLLICLLSFALLLSEAEAKRFGGGRSFGVNRSSSSTSYSRPSTQPAPAAAPTSGASKWLGPLAGVAAGGLLASLFMGHGLGGAIGSGLLILLIVGGIVLLAMAFLRSKNQYSPQSQASNPFAANQPFSTNQNFSNVSPISSSSPNETGMTSPTYPEGFDPEPFLREAKAHFIRMQASYDTKNLNDIREFTTPEVFAEIQLQLQERGDEENYTEVVQLNGEVLEAANEFGALHVSTRFSGLIKESKNEPATHFDEIWHFEKEPGKRWAVAGVQQK